MFRLKEFRDKHGLTQKAVAEIFSCQQSNIAAIEKEGKDLTEEQYSLLEGKYGKENVDSFQSEKTNKDQAAPRQGVPYWNLPVSAGRSIADVIGASKPDGFISGLPGVDIAENILPVTGTSMEPEISPGAIIGVRLMNNYDTLNTERIYLIITNDDRMIKRVEHDTENEDILWCVSPNYPKFKIYKNDVIEIHRVCFVYNPK